MWIEDRLRTGLAPDDGAPAVGEPAIADALIVDDLVLRANRRRRRRIGAGVAVTAASAVIALIVASTGLPDRREEQPPVQPPATTPTALLDEQGFQPQTSPVDNSGWSTRGYERSVLLRSLAGTGLETYGPQVYDASGLALHRSELDMRFGGVTLRLGHVGLRHGTPAGVWAGTYSVKGDRVTFRFDGLGTSTFRWHRKDVGRSHVFHLELVSADGPEQNGAPVEVLLRMVLTAYPFRAHSGP